MLSLSELFGGFLMIIAAIISSINPEEDEEFEHEQLQHLHHHEHGQQRGGDDLERQYVMVDMKYGSMDTRKTVVNGSSA